MTLKQTPLPVPECANSLSGQRNVPVLVEDGRVVQVGWQGRSCVVETD